MKSPLAVIIGGLPSSFRNRQFDERSGGGSRIEERRGKRSEEAGGLRKRRLSSPPNTLLRCKYAQLALYPSFIRLSLLAALPRAIPANQSERTRNSPAVITQLRSLISQLLATHRKRRRTFP